jgi:protein TonB
MYLTPRPSLTGRIVRFFLVIVGAGVLTTAFFMILPVLQAISDTGAPDQMVRPMETTNAPPPPPPPPEEEKKEEETEPEETPPQLEEPTQPLDLSQLELALNPGGEGSGGFGGSDLVIRLSGKPGEGGASSENQDLFSDADLDQKPRGVYMPNPVLSAEARRKTPGTVHVIFIVNENGRVENPIVQSASDPVFERPALAAVKQWKFEPGKRAGQPVRFRMRVPMTFQKGQKS